MSTLLARARRRLGGRASDEGSTVLEVVILAPALALFLGLIVAGGRLAVAHQSVEAAGAQAARAASIARTQDEALTAARSAATSALDDQGLNCVTSDVSVDVAGFATPVGAPASVGVTVMCEVSLADTLPGLPGTIAVSSTVRSALDTYRER